MWAMSNIITTQSMTDFEVSSLMSAFLTGRKKTTLEAYKRDLVQFSGFVGSSSSEEAAKRLLMLELGQANLLAMKYKAYLIDDLKLQSATVNRRLAAIRSLVRLARTLGLISWALEIQNQKHETYRDVRGIGSDGIKAIFNYLENKVDVKSVRDFAIFHLLYDLGLRREEVCTLELEDFNEGMKTLSVLGKGKSQKQHISLPEITVSSVKKWLSVRGQAMGPLFFRLDKGRNEKFARLTGTGLYSIIHNLGRNVGIENMTVHKIRHDSITSALKVAAENNIGLDDVRKFSRHSDIKTLLIYKDEIDDAQGSIAALVANKMK